MSKACLRAIAGDDLQRLARELVQAAKLARAIDVSPQAIESPQQGLAIVQPRRVDVTGQRQIAYGVVVGVGIAFGGKRVVGGAQVGRRPQQLATRDTDVGRHAGASARRGLWQPRRRSTDSRSTLSRLLRGSR